MAFLRLKKVKEYANCKLGRHAGSPAQSLIMQASITLSHLRAGMCHQLLEFIHGYLAGTGKP